MVEGHKQIRPDRSQLDKELVERVKKGDQTAYAELVDAYSRVFYALVIGYVHDHHLAEDLVQDGFIEIYRSLSNLQDSTRFGSFGYTIVRRLCFKAIKKMKRDPITQSKVSISDTPDIDKVLSISDKSETMKIRQQHEEIIKSLYELPEQTKDVAMLFFFGELDYTQISQLLKISWKSVDGHIYRARKFLREKLGGFI